MMRKIFLWFYCLPIADVVMLLILVTGGFVYLRKRYEKTVCWKAAISALLVLWLAVIFFGTLGQRTEGGNPAQPVLVPFASYYAAVRTGSRELYRTNFMNAVLFYPAGLLGCELLPKKWNWVRRALPVTAVLALGSIGIEYAQYRFGLGLAETDDVIHNALGALLGTAACRAAIRTQPHPGTPFSANK